MPQRLYKLLFSPKGRIGRGEFLAGLALLVLFVLAQKKIFPYLGTSLLAFYVPMLFFFLTFHMVLCVFGKRLHDFGRSLWPFIGLVFLMIIVSIIVMLAFGGLEYFNTVIAHPEYADTPDAMKKVSDIYSQTLAENMPKVRLILLLPPVLFTLWLVLRPSDTAENRYGRG